jgi:type I restriction enzyme R subunit
MRLLINAKDSDIFDVLAYVRFSLDPKTRTQRADQARSGGLSGYESEMCAFLSHVLAAYEVEGSAELEINKLSHFLRIKYGSTGDGKRALGELSTIRGAFIDVQGHLYRE